MLRTLARKATTIYEAHLAATGLTLPQYGLLSRLDRLEPCSLSDLAAAADLDLTSASRSVGALVDATLVSVSRGADGRTKAYRLSRTGRDVLGRAYAAWEAAQRELAALISPRDRRVVAELARAVAGRARALTAGVSS